MPQNRQLAAILFTDIVGSTAIMQKDEQAALSINKRYIAVLKQSVSSHGGKILNDYGDGSLCTFTSATQAVKCAMEIQQLLRIEPVVPLRIGLHIGEIFFEAGKVFGDGVNVASRVQSLGVANSVLFSSEINTKIKNQQEFKIVSIGQFHFKYVDDAIEVFALANEGFVIPDRKKIEGKLKEKKEGRKRNITAIAAAIFLVLGFFLFRSLNGKQIAAIKSIAVLPFLNGSSDKENEYLGDGIAQEIISQISKINSLEVIGWASSVSFKNISKSLKEKADELGAESIVSGSIQKEGAKVLIRVELTDAGTGKRIWGEEYNREWGDLLNIQTEVARKIADALNTKLTQQEKTDLSKHYTENIEAYNYYRKGRWFWEKRTPKDQDSAEVNYKNAIALDHDYALAYSGLADIYAINTKGLGPMDAIPLAKQYVAKALELDSNLSEALATSGLINCIFDYDWPKAKILFEKAIIANPNYSFAHVFYGNLLQWNFGKAEEGIIELKKALSLDPLSSTLNYVVGRNYYLAKQYDSAYLYLKKTYIMDPNLNLTKSFYAFALIQRKNFAEAENVLSTSQEGGSNLMIDVKGPSNSYLYAVSGDKVRAKSVLEKSLKDFPNQSPYHIARAFIAIGDFGEALSYLEKSYEVRDIRMWHITVDPTLDPIRNEPRFKTLLKKINMVN